MMCDRAPGGPVNTARKLTTPDHENKAKATPF